MMEVCMEMRDTADKGRGMFALGDLPAGKIVETAPVIVMSPEDRELLEKTALTNYIFEWGDDVSECCMALGFVPLYNHSYESNCEYEMDFEQDTITIKTIREVARDEELTINYNGDWNSGRKVWFDVK